MEEEKKYDEASDRAVGRRFKIFLRSNGFNQKEFGNKLKMSQQTISSYCQNGKIPYHVLLLLESVFNLNIDWLLLGKGSMESAKNTRINKVFSREKKYDEASDEVKRIHRKLIEMKFDSNFLLYSLEENARKIIENVHNDISSRKIIDRDFWELAEHCCVLNENFNELKDKVLEALGFEEVVEEFEQVDTGKKFKHFRLKPISSSDCTNEAIKEKKSKGEKDEDGKSENKN